MRASDGVAKLPTNPIAVWPSSSAPISFDAAASAEPTAPAAACTLGDAEINSPTFAIFGRFCAPAINCPPAIKGTVSAAVPTTFD